MGTILAVLLVAAVVLTALPKPFRNIGLFLMFVNLVLYTAVYILHLTIS